MFKNVKFAYPTRKDTVIFNDLNIEIKPNQKVAFVGESGCIHNTFNNKKLIFIKMKYKLFFI